MKACHDRGRCGFGCYRALADPIAREQARADLHQARADAARADLQKENSEVTAAACRRPMRTDAQVSGQPRPMPAACRRRPMPRRPRPIMRRRPPMPPRPRSTVRRSSAAQADANRDAALDRAADARSAIRSN